MAYRKLIYDVPCHSNSTLAKLQRQFCRGENCDLLVRMKGACVLAHRCIVLAFMNKVEVKPAENGLFALEIESFLPSVVRPLLDMMYSGELMCNPDLVPSLQEAASQLGFEEAVRGCKLYTSMNYHMYTEKDTIDIATDPLAVKIKEEPEDAYDYNAVSTGQINSCVDRMAATDEGDLPDPVQQYQTVSVKTEEEDGTNQQCMYLTSQSGESSLSVHMETVGVDEQSDLAHSQHGTSSRSDSRTVSSSVKKALTEKLLASQEKQETGSGSSRRSSRLRDKTTSKNYVVPDEDDIEEQVVFERPKKRAKVFVSQMGSQKTSRSSPVKGPSRYKRKTPSKAISQAPVKQRIYNHRQPPAYPPTIAQCADDEDNDSDEDSGEEEGVPVYNYTVGEEIDPPNYKPGPSVGSYTYTPERVQKQSQALMAQIDEEEDSSSSDGEEPIEVPEAVPMKIIPGNAIVPHGVRSKYAMPRVLPSPKETQPTKAKPKIYICHPSKPVVNTATKQNNKYQVFDVDWWGNKYS